MRATERVERLRIVAGLRQSTAIGGEHRHVLRIADHSLLEYGDRLRALSAGAQGARVGNGGVGITRIIAITVAPSIALLPPIGIAARNIASADRAGSVAACGGAAGR